MNKEFIQKLIIAVVSGLFILGASYIAKSSQPANMVGPSALTSGNNIAISNGGIATSTSNVSIIDQRVSASDGGIAVSGNGNVNINQNSNNSSNMNLQINGQRF